MQRLHLVTEDRRFKHDEMLLAPLRGVQPITGMLYVGQHTMLLVLQSAWQKCGAVVPHCDFQKVSPRMDLCKGSFLYVRTRRARLRAPPPMGSITTMVPTQLTEYYILQSFRVLKPLAAFSRFA